MIAERLDALIAARIHASAKPLKLRAIVDALVRYTPPTLTEAAWRDRLDAAITALRERGVIDDRLRLIDKAPLVAAFGKAPPRRWQQLANKILPALGLGVAPDAAKPLGDASHPWAAAIVGRALGLWLDGPPPTLAGVCDAFAWRQLGLPGKPKACPAEIRAVFVQRELASDPGPPDRLVRLYAAKLVGAPRAEPRALVDALVRQWYSGTPIGPRTFAAAVRAVANTARDGVFGDRKVFIASVWNELRRAPGYATLALAEFKSRLVAAHQDGALELARADHVAAVDPELVATSETTSNGASFHFIVREAS